MVVAGRVTSLGSAGCVLPSVVGFVQHTSNCWFHTLTFLFSGGCMSVFTWITIHSCFCCNFLSTLNLVDKRQEKTKKEDWSLCQFASSSFAVRKCVSRCAPLHRPAPPLFTVMLAWSLCLIVDVVTSHAILAAVSRLLSDVPSHGHRHEVDRIGVGCRQAGAVIPHPPPL